MCWIMNARDACLEESFPGITLWNQGGDCVLEMMSVTVHGSCCLIAVILVNTLIMFYNISTRIRLGVCFILGMQKTFITNGIILYNFLKVFVITKLFVLLVTTFKYCLSFLFIYFIFHKFWPFELFIREYSQEFGFDLFSCEWSCLCCWLDYVLHFFFDYHLCPTATFI